LGKSIQRELLGERNLNDWLGRRISNRVPHFWFKQESTDIREQHNDNTTIRKLRRLRYEFT
jgi:hypothetical protein